MSELFNMAPYDPGDKNLVIKGPGDDWERLLIYVDFDGVDHESVKPQAERVVKILNAHWEITNE